MVYLFIFFHVLLRSRWVDYKCFILHYIREVLPHLSSELQKLILDYVIYVLLSLVLEALLLSFAIIIYQQSLISHYTEPTLLF